VRIAAYDRVLWRGFRSGIRFRLHRRRGRVLIRRRNRFAKYRVWQGVSPVEVERTGGGESASPWGLLRSMWRRLSPVRRMEQRRLLFLKGRRPESDRRFLEATGCKDPALRLIAVLVRRQLARACSVPRQMLRHDDSPHQLDQLMDWGCKCALCNVDWAMWNPALFDIQLVGEINQRTGLHIWTVRRAPSPLEIPLLRPPPEEPTGWLLCRLCALLREAVFRKLKIKRNLHAPQTIGEWVLEVAQLYLGCMPPDWIEKVRDIAVRCGHGDNAAPSTAMRRVACSRSGNSPGNAAFRSGASCAEASADSRGASGAGSGSGSGRG